MTDERIASESSRSPYGGQALIEGVMIRGLRAMAMAARTPDGRIITRSDLADATSGDALRMLGIIRIGGRDAREEVLVGLARKKVAVLEGLLAELRQKLVALGVRVHFERGAIDGLAGADRSCRIVARNL